MKSSFGSAAALAPLLLCCQEELSPLLNRLDSPVDLVVLSDSCPKIDVSARQGHYFAFVTNATVDAVRAIDLNSHSFLLEPKIGIFPLSIPTGMYPGPIAASSDNCSIFAVNRLSRSMTVISVADALMTRLGASEITAYEVQLSGEPVDIVTAGAPQSEDLLGAAAYLSVADPPALDVIMEEQDEDGRITYSVGLTQPLAGRPAGLALSEDGARLFIALSGLRDDSLLYVNTKSLEYVGVPVAGPQTRLGLVPPPYDRYLYAVKPQSRSVAVIDTMAAARPVWLNVNENGHPPCNGSSEECDISIPGLPRDIAFYTFGEGEGRIRIYRKGTSSYEYPADSIGLVTSANGEIYVIDATEGHHHLIDGDAESASIKGPELLKEGNLVEIDPSRHPTLQSCPEPGKPDAGADAGAGWDAGLGEPETPLCQNGITLSRLPEANETWKITYEGVLPATESSFGKFLEDEPNLFEDYTVDFSRLPLVASDLLEILPDAEELDAGTFGGNEEDCPRQYRIRAVAGPNTLELEAGPKQDCFPGYLRYRLRAGSSYTVEGSLSPFSSERAHEAAPYSNQSISFTLLPAGGMKADGGFVPADAGQPPPTEQDTLYRFEVVPNSSPVSVSISGMPSGILTYSRDVFVILEGSETLVRFNPPDFDTSAFEYYR